MNNNPYSAELYQWVKKRSSAKRKMVTGIVFSAIAYFIFLVGVGVSSSAYDEDMYLVAGIIILVSLPFWAVGLPLLITGIVNMAKAKRQISRITAEQRRAEAAQQGYQQPNYQQPNYQQPNYQQPNYQQPNYQQPNYQQPNYQQPNYQQPNYQQPNYQQSNYQQPNYQQPIYQPPMYQQQPQQPAQQPVYQPPMPEQSAPEQPADTSADNNT